MVVLTKRIDDLTKGKSEKGKNKKGKSEKGLIAESFDWDKESVFSEDEGTTRIKAFMAITEDEPSIGKAYARCGQWICSKVTLDQLLSEQIPGNIVKALGGREPLPPLPKLIGVAPADKKTLIKLKAQSPLEPTSKKALMIPKPFKECKYNRFNDHHSNNCEYYPGCEVCGSIAHEPADCPKKHPNSRKPKIANKQSTKPTEKWESGPKVFFRDDSSGDTEGYGLVNCNGITFIRVAYVNRLKHNLISISQLCDANFKVLFTKTHETIFNQNDGVILIALRRRDVYFINMASFNKESNACFVANASPNVNWLWHKRLSHLNFKNINNLAKHNLVCGLPSLTFSKDKNCLTCEKGRHHRASFKTKRSFSFSKSLHLLHIDLFGPVKPQTISHNKYTLVIVDEYSRYTWVFCLKKKSDAADCIVSFIRKMKNLNENFSSPCTPEQNGVAERRNRTLIEEAITMLNSAKLPKQFWGEAVNTACYTQNRSIIVKGMGRQPIMDHLGKFDEKADDGFFLGYSLVAKAFRVFNIRRQEIEETVHVTFSEDDEAISQSSTEGDTINFNENRSFPDDEFLEPRSKVTQCSANIYFPYIPAYENITPANSTILQHSVSSEDPLEFIVVDDQPALTKVIPQPHVPQDRWSREKHIELVNIISEPLAGITTRSRFRDSKSASAHECLYVSFLSKMEPKKHIEALEEEGWIIAMQEELNQFERNKVWTLVTKLHGKTIIETKWIWKNKMDENGVVIKNKMDVKSTFLKEKILEEVYVQQPPGFESSEFSNHVCKLDKALYGLKQAPKIYVDDIIFGSTSSKLSKQFGKLMIKKYEMSMMGPDESKVSVNQTLFRGMIWSLMYLTTSRPDIQFSTCLCAREFWYSAKVDEVTKTITSSLSSVEKPLTFTRDEFISAIGLPIFSNAFPLPPKETVRPGLATLGLSASFQKPLASEVSLTSHMLKVAKLSQDPEPSLIFSSEIVNADDTADKSSSKTSVQPVTQPKAPTDLKPKNKKISSSSKPKSSYKVRVILPKTQVAKTQHAEETVATADATKSLDTFESADDQVNQPKTAEAKKEVNESGLKSMRDVTFEQLIDEVDKQNQDAQEKTDSSFDTESKIKIIKSFKVVNQDIEVHSANTEETDSGLCFMPDDDIVPALSDPFSHLQGDMHSLNTKVDQLESSISKSVADEIKSSIPSCVVDAIKEQLPGLITQALKACLPQIQESIQQTVQLSLEAHLPQFATQKELSKIIKTKIGKSVKAKVRNGMRFVSDRIAFIQSFIATNSQHVSDLRQAYQDMIFLLESVEDFKKANVEGEKEITPLRDESKGKGIATEEPLKDLMPYIEEGGSMPKILKLTSFITPDEQLTQEDIMAQVKEMKRLAENEKVDELPITKIGYRVTSSNDATMRITRGKNPLNVVVNDKFRLKTLGFSEWLKVHALASKTKRKSNDQLLKNLRAKFQWVISQAQKLGIPPPQELSNFRISTDNKKRKRSLEILHEVFVKVNIVVDGMQRNLIPPPGIEGSRGRVIREPGSGIIFYSGNFDLVFKREEEFHLATTTQLIRLRVPFRWVL
nr:hypothetical protein [Tanacetum cinerariifolium]